MIFLDEFKVNQHIIKFWSGFNLQTILKHPKDGSSGFLVVLVKSIDEERVKYQRDSKINQIINLQKGREFDDLLESINNNWVMIYQSRGEDVQLVNILKEKFSKTGFLPHYRDNF
jgi:hypothetical protein